MTNHRRDRSPARSPKRRPRSARPACEALEGRALLAAFTAYDPTFGRRGAVAGVEPVAPAAVAVQSDGKVVAVGTLGAVEGSPAILGRRLVARRFNADGSPDAAFGIGGLAEIPLPADAVGVLEGPHDVAVGADGTITLAATAALQPGPTANRGIVARLTAAGQLDAGFGTGGEFVFAAPGAGASALALDGAGRVLVLGGDAGTNATGRMVLTRLTSAGQLDATFNGTGSLAIALPAAQAVPPGSVGVAQNYNAAGMVVAPDGSIYAAGNNVRTSNFGSLTANANLARVDADGTLDLDFGAGGTADIGAGLGEQVSMYPTVLDLAIQPDGRLVAVGSTYAYPGIRGFIRRLLPDGTPDATFAANSSILPRLGTFGVSYDAVAVGPDGVVTVGVHPAKGGTPSVERYTTAGVADPNFGHSGRFALAATPPLPPGQVARSTGGVIRDIATTPDGRLVVAGSLRTTSQAGGQGDLAATDSALLARLLPVRVTLLPGDFDADGVSDIAALLAGPAVYAYRPSGGAADALAPFGLPGAGNTIPTPGDFDGDGRTDLAAYVPSQGLLDYRTPGGAPGVGAAPQVPLISQASDIVPDVRVSFGQAGDIPAVGDYDGDGISDPAVYDQRNGSFIVRPSTNPPGGTLPFGAPGLGKSIPAPGDYDGDGKTDLAVYLTDYAILAYRPSSGGPDVLAGFGLTGVGATIPAPGDYDGDGKTDVAAFIPRYALYAYRPSSGRPGDPDVWAGFGLTGVGATIPAPGDYDGDGKFDIAAYVPQYALYAYRPSGATTAVPDVWTTFGIPGDGQTVPASSIPAARPPVVSASALASSGSVEVPLALTGDVLDALAGTPGRKKKA